MSDAAPASPYTMQVCGHLARYLYADVCIVCAWHTERSHRQRLECDATQAAAVNADMAQVIDNLRRRLDYLERLHSADRNDGDALPDDDLEEGGDE